MRLVVCVKQVRVIAGDVALNHDATDVEADSCDDFLNEWDAAALELALKWRDTHEGAEIVVVTNAGSRADPALRQCLAMGADRAVRVEPGALDPISTAARLACAVSAESPHLVLCGVQSSDSAQSSTGAALAEFLGLPCVTVVTALEWSGEGRACVMRELDGGLVESVVVETPAVLTVQTGENRPRYATLRAIKQAERREIAVIHAPEDRPPAYRIRRLFSPSREHAATMLSGSPHDIAKAIAGLIHERLA